VKAGKKAGVWSEKGQTRMEEKPAVPPNQARQLDTGEALIVYG